MALPSSEQIKIYTGGNYTTLEDFFNRKIVVKMTFNPSNVFTVSGVNFTLIDNTMLSGLIAKDITSTGTNGQILMAGLAGLVGTGSNQTTSDSNGRLANLIDIRYASSNDPVIDTSDGKRVYGLIQCSNTVLSDGTIAVGASGSENTQISFVKYDATDTLVLVNITGDIEFTYNKLYSQRYYPVTHVEGAAPEIEIINPIKIERHFVVTTALASGETITISTGACSGTGVLVSTKDSNLRLPSSDTNFNLDGRVQVYRNGQKLDKGTGLDVEWVSSNSFKVNAILKINEIIEIIAPPSY